MTITVIRQQDETRRTVWHFVLIDLRLVVDEYREETRASRRHAWRNDAIWRRLMRRDTTDRPTAPQDVRDEALRALVAHITIEE